MHVAAPYERQSRARVKDMQKGTNKDKAAMIASAGPVREPVREQAVRDDSQARAHKVLSVALPLLLPQCQWRYFMCRCLCYRSYRCFRHVIFVTTRYKAFTLYLPRIVSTICIIVCTALAARLTRMQVPSSAPRPRASSVPKRQAQQNQNRSSIPTRAERQVDSGFVVLAS